MWAAIKPLLHELVDDPTRLAGGDAVDVDEHIWHHQPRPGKGPKEQTGIVNLPPRAHPFRPTPSLLKGPPPRSWLHCSERCSSWEHPLAAAIIAGAQVWNLALPVATAFDSITADRTERHPC